MGARIKKALFFILVFGLSASMMSAQSLVELAKKEKERRASLRAEGKTRMVVTNKDLTKFEMPARESAFLIVPEAESIIQPRQRSTPPPKIKVSVEPQLRRSDRRFGISRYATQILPSSRLVERPEAALRGPDGQYAEISILGILDFEADVKNGPGSDIAIYARLGGARQLSTSSQGHGHVMESFIYGYDIEGFWYGVLGMTEKGEWEEIGRAIGNGSPDTFDLGGIGSITKLRIMFRPYNNADLAFRLFRVQEHEFTFGIDAIEILH
jgi:hypothetical protein